MLLRDASILEKASAHWLKTLARHIFPENEQSKSEINHDPV